MKYLKPFLMLLLTTAGSCITWSCTASHNPASTSSQQSSNLLVWGAAGVGTVTAVAAVLKHTLYNRFFRANQTNYEDQYAAEQKRLLPDLKVIKAVLPKNTQAYSVDPIASLEKQFISGPEKEKNLGLLRNACFQAIPPAQSYSPLKFYLFKKCWQDSCEEPTQIEIGMIQTRYCRQTKRFYDERQPLFANNSWRPIWANVPTRWNAFWSLV